MNKNFQIFKSLNKVLFMIRDTFHFQEKLLSSLFFTSTPKGQLVLKEMFGVIVWTKTQRHF